MSSPLSILTHTPFWVWGLLVLLIAIGIGRMRDQTITLTRMLIFPAVMALLSLSGLVHAGLTVLPALLAGLAAGGFVGWLREGNGSTRRLADGRIWLRGDWTAPILNAAVFAVHYVTSATAIIDPALAADSIFQITAAGLSSFFAALFIGRSAARLQRWRSQAPAHL